MDDFNYYTYMTDLEKLHKGYNTDAKKAVEYAYTLANTFNTEEAHFLDLVENKLKKLYYTFKSDDIAIFYANILQRIAINKVGYELDSIFRILRDLYARHMVADIGLAYVFVMHRILYTQDYEENKVNIKIIDGVYFKHQTEAIAYYYLDSLKLVIETDKNINVKETLNICFNVYNSYPTERNAIMYSKILVKAIINFPNAEFYNEVFNMKNIFSRYDTEEIAINFLFFLAKQTASDTKLDLYKNYVIATNIYNKYSSLIVDSCYSYVLLNYIKKINLDQSLEIMLTLKHLIVEHNTQEMVTNYLEAVIAIINKTNIFQEDKFYRVKEVYDEYGNEKISSLYSKCLRVIILKFGKLEYIDVLEELYKKYPNKDVTFNYVTALSFVFKFTKNYENDQIIKKIEYAYIKSNDEDITNLYIKVLGVYAHKNENNFDSILDDIEAVVLKTNSQYIFNSYLKILINLIKICTHEHKEKAIRKIDDLYKEKNTDFIAVKYIEAIGFISDEALSDKNLKLLNKIYKNHKNREVAIAYCNVIADESNRKNKKFLKFAVKKITSMYKTYKTKDFQEHLKTIYFNANLSYIKVLDK